MKRCKYYLSFLWMTFFALSYQTLMVAIGWAKDTNWSNPLITWSRVINPQTVNHLWMFSSYVVCSAVIFLLTLHNPYWYSSSWWLQPYWKYQSNCIISPGRGEQENIWNHQLDEDVYPCISHWKWWFSYKNGEFPIELGKIIVNSRSWPLQISQVSRHVHRRKGASQCSTLIRRHFRPRLERPEGEMPKRGDQITVIAIYTCWYYVSNKPKK